MKLTKYFSIIFAAFILLSCVSKVPVTERKQRLLNDEQMLIDQAKIQYDNFLANANVLPETDPRTRMIKDMGEKIKNATLGYLEKHNRLERVEGFEWEFNVVEDSIVNAWCMPGGKVVFYTGIMSLAEDEDELAVVMGHEIAHAIARHGNERISQQYKVNAGGVLLDILTGENGEVFKQIYGVGSTLGVLKYSRKHESESDKMGLVFMKLAGYDPYKAISFWQKMSANGGSIPEIFSTHPSDETRIADIEAFLKEIDQYTE